MSIALRLREMDRLEHRVLGAVRCVDGATGAPLDLPMQVSAPDARIQRNRSGLYVIAEWTTLADHAESFSSPPNAPAVGDETLTLSISDPSGRYLPRSVDIDLPRDPLPANAANANSLFRPVDVPMYPSGVAPVVGNWAAVRVSLTEDGTGDALGGALLRVVRDGNVIARGLTDWRGEALVPVVGIPVTTWSTDPNAVIVTEIEVTIEAGFDATSGLRTSADDVADGTVPASLPQVNPEDLNDDFAGLPQTSTTVMLAAGRPLHVSLQINLP